MSSPLRKRHEVRITSSGSIKGYVGYAERILDDPEIGQVKFLGEGKTINKTVSVAEIVKRKRPGLHQVTELNAGELDDHGKENPKLTILLASEKDMVDTRHPGYAVSE